MDDRDLFSALSRSHTRKHAAAGFVRSLKTKKAAATPGLVDTAKAYIKANPAKVTGAVTGATLAGFAQYLMNQRKKDGGPSSQQSISRRALDDYDRSEAKMKERGEEPGFSHRVGKTTTKAISELSDVFADHPGKGAMLVIPAGAAAGMSLAKFLKRKP